MLVLLSGTLVTTIIWCLILGIRNRSLYEYVKCGTRQICRKLCIFLCCGISLVYAIYFLWHGKKQNGTIHIYILGNTGSPYHRIRHPLGYSTGKNGRTFHQTVYSYGPVHTDNNSFILYNRYKRFCIINHPVRVPP